MAITLIVPSLLTLFCVLLLLLLAHPLDAQYVVNEDFVTKSGTRVKLSLIKRYLKYATDEQLSHMVFQLDAGTRELTSHHRVITIPNNAPRTRIDEPDFLSTNDRTKPRPLFYRNNHNGYFFYTLEENLVAAWGDTLDIHPLNSRDHPDIYINHFLTPDAEAGLPSSKVEHNVKRPHCKEEYNLEFDVRFDEELCARYGHSFHITQKVLQVFMQKSARAIQDMTCVHISALDIFGTCRGNRDHGRFDWSVVSTKNCAGATTATTGCDSISEEIMDIVENDFKLLEIGDPGYVPNDYQDMRLVFSGLQGAGSLAGIAYRAQASSADHGNSWISGVSRVALYHEIGHMLGANHDEVGIMRANVRIGEDLLFSDRSRSEMVRFVTADPRSWCLRRKLGTLEDIVKDDGWGPAVDIPEITYEGKTFNSMGMTLASITDSSSAKRDLILGYRTRNEPYTPRLFLRLFSKVLATDNTLNINTDPVDLFEIKDDFKPSEKFAYRISAGKITDKTSTDLVLLYVTRRSTSNSRIDIHVPHYHVGFGMSTSHGPTRWTSAIPISRPTLHLPTERFSRRDVWVGNVRTSSGADLVYVELKRSYGGIGVVSYKIGFDLSPISGQPAEWSEEYRIPGEFSKGVRSISISVIDIDGNGMPDLVFYVQGFGLVSASSSRSKYAFIRVGKDLDEMGRVTNGWTRFKRIPASKEIGKSAIDTTSSVTGSGPPVLIALSRVDQAFTLSTMAGKNVPTPELMATGRSESSVDALNEGCSRCYKGSKISTCIKDVDHCRAQIDELNIQRSLSSVGRRTETTRRVSVLDFTKSLSERESSGTAENSMFCLGFHELRKKNSGCDVVDETILLAKGLEIALSDAITTDLVSRSDIETLSMFEDPLGTSGNGQPIIAQITIHKSVKSTLKGAIREAEKRMRNQFPSFKQLFNKNKVGREEKSWKHKWTIKYFKKNGFNYDDIF